MLPASKYDFVLCHYPIASWENMNRGVIHLHGHVHLPPSQRLHAGKSMDVGMDGNNLHPINVRDIISIMNKQPVSKTTLLTDHHEEVTR
jgi:calcineurin-like phosphoesterase family protein